MFSGTRSTRIALERTTLWRRVGALLGLLAILIATFAHVEPSAAAGHAPEQIAISAVDRAGDMLPDVDTPAAEHCLSHIQCSFAAILSADATDEIHGSAGIKIVTAHFLDGRFTSPDSPPPKIARTA